MNVGGRVRLQAGTILLAVVWLGVLLLAYWGGTARPVVYRIPAGFSGWALIEYDNPACPPLRADGLWLVVPIRPTGYGCTSSHSEFPAYHLVRYEYVDMEGRRTPIPSTIGGGGGGIWSSFAYGAAQNVSRRPVEGFFVGSEQQWRRNVDAEPRPWLYVPPIGPQP
jgi:hypothetical protein